MLPVRSSSRRSLSRVSCFITRPTTAHQQQIRGKKKNAKPKTTLPVRLITDLPGFGKAGSIVPVTIGQMRNIYFPRQIADYVTLSEQRDLRKNGVVVQRDPSFGKVDEAEGEDNGTQTGAQIKDQRTKLVRQPARSSKREKAVRVDIERYTPGRAFEVLQNIIPPVVQFYRRPTEENVEVTPEPTVNEPTTEPGPAGNVFPSGRAIYGSVSKGDIVTNLKAVVAGSEEAAGKIVLGEGDVTFAYSRSEDRVKQLGDFEIDINIMGYKQPLRRTISVLPEGDAPMDPEMGNRIVEEVAGENPIKEEEADEDVLRMEARSEAIIEDAERLEQQTRETLEETAKKMEEQHMTPAQEAEIEESGAMEPDRPVLEGVAPNARERKKRP